MRKKFFVSIFLCSFLFQSVLLRAMALLVESRAQFRSRAVEIGLTVGVIDAFVNGGIDTMTKMAFWVNQPGTTTDEAALTRSTNAMLGRDPTVAEVTGIKILHFESQAFTLQSLKNSIEGPGSDVTQPKKIPLAEKEARLTEIRGRLNGVDISGPLEPATALFEHAVHQRETKVLKYLPPEKCYSREHEIKHAKPAKNLQIEGGTLTLKEGSAIPSESVYTSLQFQQAMTRRALAYDFAQLISFDVSRRYCDKLLRHLDREPPPGYMATSLGQLIKADQQVWAKLAEAGSNIRRDGAGVLPLDNLLIQTLESYEIAFYLLPMVSNSSSSGAYYKGAGKESVTYRPQPYGHYDDRKGKGKGKKGKGKKGREGHVQTWVPPRLRGGKPVDASGQPICFNYNLEGCDAAKPGQSCPRGLHICCKCYKMHPFTGNHEPDSKPAQT